MPFVVDYVSNRLTAARKSAAKKTITLADALDQLGERQACINPVLTGESAKSHDSGGAAVRHR